MLRFTFFGSVMPHSVGRHHVAVLEGGDKLRTLFGVVAKPVQKFRESPLRRIHAAAPVDGFELFAVSGRRDLRGFAFGPVVAPQVVFAERLHVLAHGNDRGTRGIESDGLDLVAGDAGFLHRLASGGGQGTHVVFVRLGGVFRVFALAVQRIFGDRGLQQPALTVHDRDADAESSEVNSSHNRHQQAPLLPGWWYMSQCRYRVVAS